ncbi:unnamed protein product [Brassicogethes aeneus]|uniref:BTB domain-containing protein n=1 Tax=Brassicogethes aeneus TaxID=1431903 RepID=A0A9P0FFU1_BRAAE|nr:unnamed protein product [Brassicogethes aeneus]
MNFKDIPECTEKCKSLTHGDIITAAISKRSISDAEICSYLNHICKNCEGVQDSAGRTALHVASSCGRLEVVRWLVQSRHADLNARDKESGYTALQRSMFYGKIHVAVELIKLGANISQLDHDSLLFLDHAMKDGMKPSLTDTDGELYAWGSNTNHVLGPQQSRTLPELFDGFYKEHPNECVQQICVDKFHSVIVASSGKVFSCGHGQGGRLGIGTQQTIVTPKLISFPENNQEPLLCINASISRDHSIFLMSDGSIFTCGLNTHHVLGIFPPPQELLVPRQIKHLDGIQGVCAQRYHSVAWSQNNLYTWGLNAGQLGHKLNNENGEKYVISPRIVKIINMNENTIKSVAGSDGATAVCTEKGDIYVLHEYQCRKIASRQLNVIQVSIVGGKLDSSLDKDLKTNVKSELKVLALTNTGNLLLWQESDPYLCRCIFTSNRAIIIRQMSINTNGVLLVTFDGEGFQGIIKPRKKIGPIGVQEKKSTKSPFHKFLDKEDCILVKLEKFPKIHRAISISSDSRGNDFCVIQAYPYTNYTFPEITPSDMQLNLKLLLEETDEYDILHDVTFKVEKRKFPVHRYIVASKCPYLEKIIENNNSNEPVVLPNINADIFEQCLMFLYTNTCDLLRIGELKNERLKNLCDKKIDNKNDTEIEKQVEVEKDVSAFEYYNKINPQQHKEKSPEIKAKNPVRMLHELSKKFKCVDLQNALSNLDMTKYTVKVKSGKLFKAKPIKFDMRSFPEHWDVVIKCRDDKIIKAHRCIMAARLEYFANMFSMRWGKSENCEITLPFPKSTALALLEYIYTDNLSGLENKEMEHLFRVLILADQLFVIRLKEQCEWLLTNLLTLKNATQILPFAHMYNAQNLKLCCIKFIVGNLAPFLESHALEELDEEILLDIAEVYFNVKHEISCRVITPYSTAVADEEISLVHTQNPVDLELEVEKSGKKSSQKRRSRTHKSSFSEKRTSESDNNLDSIIQFPDIPEVIQESKQTIELSDRVKAIMRAQNKLYDEDIKCNFEKIGKNDSGTSFDDFPELSSPPCNTAMGSLTKTPKNKVKMTKVSQKQRKRLSSQSDLNNPGSPVISESPKNPWKTITNVTSPQSTPDGKNLTCKWGMGDIISDEKKQKENLVKLKSKLLFYTQVEDKAIDDLHKFYNTENLSEEIILIERVSMGSIASPTWVPRNK